MSDFLQRLSSFRAIALALAFSACATIGDETAFPDPVESRIAPFRPLTETETGVEALRADGRIVPPGGAFGRGMRTVDALWYTHAEPLETPPDRDPTLEDHEVDWARYQPRRILRSPLEIPNRYGVDAGEVLFEADADWQGGEVFDPWAVELSDGSVRLYFAGAGGIGFVNGSGAAPFTGSEMILADARSPSAVEYQGETWLFFERDGGIGLARSSDDEAFTIVSERLDLDSFEPAEDEPREVGTANPGAVVVTSPIGRVSVRVYFTALRDDGTTDIGVSATQDGSSFDRFDGNVFVDLENGRHPAPYVDVDNETTHLIVSRPLRSGQQTRALASGLTPARIVLIPEPESEM